MSEKVLTKVIWTAFLGKHDEVHPPAKKGEGKGRASGLGTAERGQEDSYRDSTIFHFFCISAPVEMSIKEDICETC